MKDKYLGFDLRLIPLAGIVGSIVGIVLLKEAWQKIASGSAIIVILSVCTILAEKDVWEKDRKEAQPLLDLRDTQQQNTREYLKLVLDAVNWHMDNMNDERWGVVDIRISIVSLLTYPLSIHRLTSKLFIDGFREFIGFEFDNAPRTLSRCLVSNIFSQSLSLPEPMRSALREVWKEKTNKPSGRLTLRMEIEGRDPIDFDPSIDDPFNLYIGREKR